MTEDFPLGKLVCPVSVGLVERPDIVWISPDVSREILMKELESLHLSKFSKRAEIGTRAATEYVEDCRMYRCEILGEEENGVLVRYIDYGNVEIKDIGELFDLSPELTSKPALGMRVIVCGVQGISNSSKNRARVEKKLLVEGLGVVIDGEDDSGNLVGTFYIDGKPLRISKTKDSAPVSTSTPIETPKSHYDSTRDSCIDPNVGVNSGDIMERLNREHEAVGVKLASKENKSVVAEEKSELRDVEQVEIDDKPVEVEDKSVAVKPVVVEDKGANIKPDSLEDNPVAIEDKSVAVTVEYKPVSLALFYQLPELMLSDGVSTAGCVVNVSLLGSVWFSPDWVQATLDMICESIEVEEGKLLNISPSQVVKELICLARFSEDGALYRARILDYSNISRSSVTVQFFDFGNVEEVFLTEVFSCPISLAKFTPAAVELMIRHPIDCEGEKRKEILQNMLLDVDGISVVVNTNEVTGEKSATFYIDNKEIIYEGGGKIKVYDHQNVNDPTIEEYNNIGQSTVDGKDTTAVKLVEAAALSVEEDTAVFLSYIETISKVWVIREEDEERSLNMINILAKVSDMLVPTQGNEVGHIYSGRFSEDEEMYRCVVTSRGCSEDRVCVRFIDHGNSETMYVKDLFNIPINIAREPAVALLVEIKDNQEEKDSQINRDMMEIVLSGEKVTVNSDGNFKVDESFVKFDFKDRILIKDLPKDPFSQSVKTHAEFPAISGVSPISDRKAITDNVNQSTKLSAPADFVMKKEYKASRIVSSEIDVEDEVDSQNNKSEIMDDHMVTNIGGVVASMPEGFDGKKIPSTMTGYKIGPSGDKPTTEKPADLKLIEIINDGEGIELNVPLHLAEESSKSSLVGTLIKSKFVGSNLIETAKLVNNQNHNDQSNIAHKKPEQTMYIPPGRRSRQCLEGVTQQEIISKDIGTFTSLWSGMEVVAQWPGNGGWQKAVVRKLDKAAKKVWVEGMAEGGIILGPAWVNVDSIRPSDLPVAALNLIDKEFKGGIVSPRKDGDGSSKELDANLLNNSQLCTIDYVSLAKTAKGSYDLQSLVASSPQEASIVLGSLLSSPQIGLKLMTHPIASRLIQKIISVLPSSQLHLLQQAVQINFFSLSTHSVGCHVVQAMLEQSDEERVCQLASQLIVCSNIIDLVSNKHGTYVAQACLSKLSSNVSSLVSPLLGHIAQLGCSQYGTFFMQQLVVMLSHQKDCEVVGVLFTEEVLAGLPLLVVNESGTRLVQRVLRTGDLSVLIRVFQWVQKNLEIVIEIRPAVFTALIVVELLVSKFKDGLGDCRNLLDLLVQELLAATTAIGNKGQSRLVLASLHPVGHLLVRDLVCKANCLGKVKVQLLNLLGQSVEVLRYNKFGAQVLMGLNTILL